MPLCTLEASAMRTIILLAAVIDGACGKLELLHARVHVV